MGTATVCFPDAAPPTMQGESALTDIAAQADAVAELRALGRDGTTELLAALSKWASRIARRKWWADGNPLGTPGGIEDFVFNVLTKVVTGDRPWSRESGHSLRQHLFECVRSEVDNLAKRSDNTVEHDAAKSDLLPSQFTSPEDAVVTRRWAVDARRIVVEAAADDPLLRLIGDLWMEGIYKPADIAEATGRSVKTINLALRKLRRRLDAMDARSSIGGDAK